jgi:dipeptidyl aminopeptidase/acylaminoacyl peptidase
MGGTADDNVPLVAGQQMYAALKLNGVPTELVAYPGANHGFRRPSYVRDRYERILAWYAAHVPAGQ